MRGFLHKKIKFIIYSSIFLLFSSPGQAGPIRTYKIILDPGHGGTKQVPYELYGDKYDVIRDKYLENYKSGAGNGSRTEMEIVMDIARETQYYLDLTKTQKGFRKFRTYLKKYTRSKTPWIQLYSKLSRKDCYADRRYREKDDKNADYRLYDYKDFRTGKHKLGRISRINKEKPYLVVSLHVNSGGGSGMGAVITPSYRTFNMIRKISLGKEKEKAFWDLPWKNWLRFKSGWNTLENATADTWIYFHGYWSTKNGKKTDRRRFEGYRQNMVTWKYKDAPGWTKKVGKPGPYSYSHSRFRAKGRFWKRERSRLELMRREDGIEKFGGDNYYAGKELLRFVQYGLRKELKKKRARYEKPGPILPPYISTYSMPTFINAINAYLELGDINSDRDIYFLTAKRKKIAESIAVGIYSLFQGISVSDRTIPYKPRGKKIDFDKYITKKGENYFKIVTER